MEREHAARQVRAALGAVLNRDAAELPDDTALFEDLGLDSTSVVELLIAVEDETGVEVEVDELAPEVFRTVGTLVDFVAATAPASVA